MEQETIKQMIENILSKRKTNNKSINQQKKARKKEATHLMKCLHILSLVCFLWLPLGFFLLRPRWAPCSPPLLSASLPLLSFLVGLPLLCALLLCCVGSVCGVLFGWWLRFPPVSLSARFLLAWFVRRGLRVGLQLAAGGLANNVMREQPPPHP